MTPLAERLAYRREMEAAPPETPTEYARPTREQSSSGWPPALASEAYHGAVGRVVRALEPHSEADPAALLVQLLAGFGNIIGRGPGFAVEGDFHATNLYVAIVGETAKARKGTSWSRVRQVLTLVDEEWAKGRVLGGLSSGEGLVHQVRDPIRSRRKAKGDELEDADDDGYVEAIEDAGEPDKRLMVVEGELAQPLKAMARPGNTLSVTLRNLWDTGKIGSLIRSSPARTSGALVSVVGHIVVDELRRELTSTEASNGFANRFLFVCARRARLLPDGGAVEPAELLPLAEELRAAVELARDVRRPMTRTNAARTLWHSVYAELSHGRDGLVGAVTARAEAQVLRLSVVYALADGAPTIDAEHLQAALAVWTYCERSVDYIFGASPGNNIADRILAALGEASTDGLTRTEIRKLVGGRVNVNRIDEALALLERRQLATFARIPTGGRPVEKWLCATRADLSSLTSVPSTLNGSSRGANA